MTIVLLTALVTWLLLFPTRAILRRFGIVDRPNARSNHTVPTIRGGGMSIVLVLTGWQIWCALHSGRTELFWLLGAFLALAIVSFIDDFRGLKPSFRFIVQAVTSAIAVGSLTLSAPHSSASTLLFGAIAWLWVAGYTNAFNFMDGINGLAGMQALITSLGTASIAIRLGVSVNDPAVVLCFAVAGAALGFLPHNFPGARVFMGDVGSAALGFILAVLAFWVARLTEPWVLFWIALLHANFVLDTGITLIRRVSRGERWHEAHREHFYQRLIQAGRTHVWVTCAETVLLASAAVILVVATPSDWPFQLVSAGGILLLWILLFVSSEKAFHALKKETRR